MFSFDRMTILIFFNWCRISEKFKKKNKEAFTVQVVAAR